MDTQQTLAHEDFSSNVDISRPFRSVKEAIAIFDERLLIGAICSTKPFTAYDDDVNPCKEIITSAWKYPSCFPTTQPNPKKDDNVEQYGLFDMLKKLEAELEETKMELKLLKEKELETEIVLATLNSELHKNKSKLAEAEAEAAAVARRATASSIEEERKEEERMKRELMIRMENSPTLAQILSYGENEKNYGGKIKERRMNMMKKKKKQKPIVPLVTEFFFMKKRDS